MIKDYKLSDKLIMLSERLDTVKKIKYRGVIEQTKAVIKYNLKTYLDGILILTFSLVKVYLLEQNLLSRIS
jgi:hypothetical protein